MKKLALLAILISLIFPWSVLAQGEYQADISKPDLSYFPRTSLTMNILQPDGTFIHGLESSSILILEDGKAITPDLVQEVRIGLQTSVVINAGPTFASRNAKGINRYDSMKEYLQTWASAQKEIDIDDLSLITNGSIQQAHMANSQAWLTALATYQPELKKSVPSLDPLSTAIQIAQDSHVDGLIHRAILYITPLPGEEMTEAVREDLISRANDARVTIFIWMLASKGDFGSAEAGHLRIIAAKTGGQLFAFSGSETFPEAQELLEPLRYLYQLEYTSKIQKGGTHNLAAKIDLEDSSISTAPVAFEINLEPVAPIFIGFPASIQRTAPQNSSDPLQELTPNGLQIEFLINYPDNLQRDLQSASLMVDGKEVVRNTAPPFNQFYWDLRSYTESGQHTLQIQVTDVLGIDSQSTSLPVEIQVIFPEKTGFQKFISGNGIYFLLFGVFVLGAASALVIIRLRGGKNMPANATGLTPQAGRKQPVDPIDDQAGQTWSAELVQLDREMNRTNVQPIRLSQSTLTWGTDPAGVTNHAEDESLEPIHCRLWFGDDHHYHLSDQNTQAGTWVNYREISTEGVVLQHGDIIQFGELTYKYLENPPQTIKNTEVLPYNI